MVPRVDWRDRNKKENRRPSLSPPPSSPVIPPIQYDRWLSPLDPDPNDLLVPFPSDPMTMWPVSTRVNKPANDDVSVLEYLKPLTREVGLQSLPLHVRVD